ncbi:MAG: hypothetical protein JKY94_17385 [Rhodobacteraceae bacterium]|nr:hypothetical protein [Paracoccaceae bacterium]
MTFIRVTHADGDVLMFNLDGIALVSVQDGSTVLHTPAVGGKAAQIKVKESLDEIEALIRAAEEKS